MPVNYLLLFGSILIVSLISFIGAITLSIKEKWLEKILPLFVAFSAGALFGDVFIHLLPETFKDFGFEVNISLYILLGIVLFFLIEKLIHFQHKHSIHFQHYIHSTESKNEKIHPFSYMNLVGDAIHNFVDGLVIAGSFLVSPIQGITTSIAVILHEIPQEMGDFGVLLAGGFSKKKALMFNFLSALAAFLGAIVALIASTYLENITMFFLPFTAGGFIYIAGSTLIPELHKETNLLKSFLQLIAFLIGIALMASLLLIE